MTSEREELGGTGPEYRTHLDSYSGPLDLLLYLIKRDEVDVFDIPITQVTQQFLDIVQTMQFLDMERAGEFLVMAATLMEIKSRMLLPSEAVEEGEEVIEEDPRGDLIRQLLQYKKFKEAAQQLEERAERHALRLARPGQKLDLTPEPVDAFKLLEDVQVWDLLAAFSALVRQTDIDLRQRIVHDDIPLAAYITEVRTRLVRAAGPVQFLSLFSKGDTRARIIGIFVALLELTRQGELRVRQPGTEFADIAIEYIPPEQRAEAVGEAAAVGEDAGLPPSDGQPPLLEIVSSGEEDDDTPLPAEETDPGTPDGP